MVARSCCRSAYLRGALLASGSVTAPPSPHLEVRSESREGAEAVTLRYGVFLQALFDFIIVAFAIFMIVKGINSLRRKEEAKPAAPPAPPRQEVLLEEIRDLLKSR